MVFDKVITDFLLFMCEWFQKSMSLGQIKTSSQTSHIYSFHVCTYVYAYGTHFLIYHTQATDSLHTPQDTIRFISCP